MNDNGFTIEKNVPLAAPRKKWKEIFGAMEVGDSFVANGGKTLAINIHGCVGRHGYRAATRKIGENQYRIWRVK